LDVTVYAGQQIHFIKFAKPCNAVLTYTLSCWTPTPYLNKLLQKFS